MYETRLSRMIMQLPLAQMANRDGDAGMETMLWGINIIPNEQDNGYLMLPPGVLHMSALGRFGRFTLFSPRVSHSKHLPCSFCFVLCFGFGVFVALLCFCFLFCKCFGIPNSPLSLDLDDRQGLIASSAMQQKKKESGIDRLRQRQGLLSCRYTIELVAHACFLSASKSKPGANRQIPSVTRKGVRWESM